MQAEKREPWMRLCEQAAAEQDPKKLIGLITEINRMLQEKEERLLKQLGILHSATDNDQGLPKSRQKNLP
jgi:hypothetical protein